MSDHVLITGGDGYVGRSLARAYLTRTTARVTLLLRAVDEGVAAAKRLALEQDLADCDMSRLSLAHADITSPAPFASLDPNAITSILHAAAVTRFNVEKALARAVNVEGTEKMLAFAECCPHLESIGVLSTVYAVGLRAGSVEERSYDSADGFANHYEWSKHEAEAAALQRASRLPLRVIRIGTLFADGDNGRVTQYNALHNTLKLYYYGLLSLVPGDADVPVYLVAGDFVRETIFAVMRSKSAHGIYHAAHQAEHNPTLGRLMELAFDVFEQHEEFRRRNVLRPLFTDEDSFGLLADKSESFSGAVTKQAIRSIRPFARQLFVHKKIGHDRMRGQVPGYAPPDHEAQLTQTIHHLIRTKWGRHDAASSATERMAGSTADAV